MKKILELYLKAQMWVLSTKVGQQAMKVGWRGVKGDIQKFWNKIFKRKNQPANKTEKIKSTNIFNNLINIAMLKNWKDWKTSIPGAVVLLVMVLNSLGIIGNEEGQAIKECVQEIIDAFGGGVVGIIGTSLTTIGGVLLLFVKDPKKDGK